MGGCLFQPDYQLLSILSCMYRRPFATTHSGTGSLSRRVAMEAWQCKIVLPLLTNSLTNSVKTKISLKNLSFFHLYCLQTIKTSQDKHQSPNVLLTYVCQSYEGLTSGRGRNQEGNESKIWGIHFWQGNVLQTLISALSGVLSCQRYSPK